MATSPSLPSKVLSFNFLSTITNGFSKERELGEGALGTVYTGILDNGGMIAVKRHVQNAPGTNNIETYTNKILRIMEQENMNIVKVLGFCCEERTTYDEQSGGPCVCQENVESLLCYEYLPMGSLHTNLFDESASRIDWDTRYKIIKGICQGLLFLHRLPLIHLDLKPQNILLDHNMIPKITDFGYSRLFGQKETRMYTVNSVGSVGYKAPEFLVRGEISARSDIYSLGLIIMEITTRERNCPSINQQSARKYVDKVKNNWAGESGEDRMMTEYPELGEDRLHQLKACIKIGLRCVELDQHRRPTIKKIVNDLDALW